MLIIGEFAYSYLDTLEYIETMEIVCSRKQYEKVKNDFDLINVIQVNRHMAEATRNGLKYRIIFTDLSPGLARLSQLYGGDGDEYIVASYEALYIIYRELTLYQHKVWSSWVRSMEIYNKLKTIWVKSKITSKKTHLKVLSLAQRDWVNALDHIIISEYEYKPQYKFFEADLLEIINPDSVYDRVVTDTGAFCNAVFFALPDNEKFQFIKDALKFDMLTQYVIPKEFKTGKVKPKLFKKFLPRIFTRVMMYMYCRNGTNYIHDFMANNYRRLIADFDDHFYHEFHMRVEKNLIESCSFNGVVNLVN
jgi:hypothetical protein